MELREAISIYKKSQPMGPYNIKNWYSKLRDMEKRMFLLHGAITRKTRLDLKRDQVWAQSNLQEESKEERQGNLLIQDTAHKISNNFNDISHLSGLSRLPLDDFFKRPVLIESFVFGTNTPEPIFRAIKPYELWSADPTVRAKLKTYAYFRGDLKVRVVITTTPYQYGSMLISNQPHADANYTLQGYLNRAGTSGGFERLNCYLSQSPEKALVQYGISKSYELLLPFISPKPVVKLYNRGGGVINNSVNYEEMGALSTLILTEFNKLEATGVSEFDSDVSVEIYAFCDNVQLSVATATDMDITAQSSFSQELDNSAEIVKGVVTNAKNKLNDTVNNNSTMKKISDVTKKVVPDEYAEMGPISTVATAVSNVANHLSSVPVIGDYAKATSFVAGRVANVAKFFGFSKPTLIDKHVYVKPTPFGPSTGSGVDTSYKLSTDPKQELALTPFGGEVPQDPMAFNFITSREAYIGSLRWGLDGLPRTTVLGSFPVDPFTNGLNTGNTIETLTPLAVPALFHHYWRGTITFRIEVIASRFSKGKLLILYEPNNEQITDINNTATLLNQQMSYYMDLDEERTKTIHCGFIFDRAFAKCRDLINTPGSIPVTAANDETATGTLTIKPLTRLSGVDGTQNARINVYVKSDDIQFAFPRNINSSNLSAFVDLPVSLPDPSPGGNIVAQSDLRVENEDKRVGPNITASDSIDINLAPKMDEKAYLYYFGEQNTSFRQLLKKDFGVEQIFTTSMPDGAVTIPVNIYPELTTNTVPILNTTSIGLDIGSRTNMFSFLRACYLFMKGGMRHRFNFTNIDNVSKGAVVVSARQVSDYTLANPGNTLTRVSPAGAAIFNRETNEGIDFEMPYFSSNLFEATYGQLGFADIGDSAVHYDNAQFQAAVNIAASSPFRADHYCAISEDFTFFRFQGAFFLGTNKNPALDRREVS